MKVHDAGEPSGTAGRPILSALEEMAVTSALVLVARTFGGIKLGAGGLKRAYHRAALASLQAAEIQEVDEQPVELSMILPHGPELPRLKRILGRHGAKVVSLCLGERIDVRLCVSRGAAPAMRAELAAELPHCALREVR